MLSSDPNLVLSTTLKAVNCIEKQSAGHAYKSDMLFVITCYGRHTGKVKVNNMVQNNCEWFSRRIIVGKKKVNSWLVNNIRR